VVAVAAKGLDPKPTTNDLPLEGRVSMNQLHTKALVVGQKVWMQSGADFIEVEVWKIAEKYIQVVGTDILGGAYGHEVFITFYKNGKQPDWDSVKGWDRSVPWGYDPRPLCGKNGEPYVLLTKLGEKSNGLLG